MKLQAQFPEMQEPIMITFGMKTDEFIISFVITVQEFHYYIILNRGPFHTIITVDTFWYLLLLKWITVLSVSENAASKKTCIICDTDIYFLCFQWRESVLIFTICLTIQHHVTWDRSVTQYESNLDMSNHSETQEAEAEIKQLNSCLFCHCSFLPFFPPSCSSWSQTSQIENWGNYWSGNEMPWCFKIQIENVCWVILPWLMWR